MFLDLRHVRKGKYIQNLRSNTGPMSKGSDKIYCFEMHKGKQRLKATTIQSRYSGVYRNYHMNKDLHWWTPKNSGTLEQIYGGKGRELTGDEEEADERRSVLVRSGRCSGQGWSRDDGRRSTVAAELQKLSGARRTTRRGMRGKKKMTLRSYL